MAIIQQWQTIKKPWKQNGWFSHLQYLVTRFQASIPWHSPIRKYLLNYCANLHTQNHKMFCTTTKNMTQENWKTKQKNSHVRHVQNVLQKQGTFQVLKSFMYIWVCSLLVCISCDKRQVSRQSVPVLCCPFFDPAYVHITASTVFCGLHQVN